MSSYEVERIKAALLKEDRLEYDCLVNAYKADRQYDLFREIQRQAFIELFGRGG